METHQIRKLKTLKMKNIYKLSFFTCLALVLTSCQSPFNREMGETINGADSSRVEETAVRQPSITVEPFRAADGDYKILTAETFKIGVNAPGAREIELFYQPVTAVDRQVKLKTLNAPVDAGGGRLTPAARVN